MIGCGILAAAAVCASPGAQGAYSPRLGSFDRLNEGRPILSPPGDGFESAGVFNPAVVRDGDRVVMLYRAQDKQGISRLGYATSMDGVTFMREPAPVLGPEAEYERGGGVEDPRLVKIDGAGHYAVNERPRALAARLDDFLAGRGDDAGR